MPCSPECELPTLRGKATVRSAQTGTAEHSPAIGDRNRAGRTALAASLVLLLGSLAFFVCFAGLYPNPCIDESFFNFPAISYLKGHGFFYIVSSQAPFWRTLWSYHGPFFPHLQVLVFWLFGVSQQVSRVPNLLAGYLAASLMAYLLMRAGWKVAPLVFTLTWLGDRAPQELQHARMDGIALLLVVLGFTMLNRFYAEPNMRNAFCVAFCTFAAVGFHPVTAYFFVLSAGTLCILAYKRGCLPRSLSGFGCGFAVVALAVLAFVQFHPIEGLQQFRWWLRVVSEPAQKAQLSDLLFTIRWSKWFFLVLAGFTVFAAMPIALIQLRRLRGDRIDSESFFKLSLALFSLAGAVCLINQAVYPYYILYFSIWPIALLAVEAEQLPRQKRPLVLSIAVAAILFVAWVPSAAWNVLRIREEVLYRKQLTHNYILGRLRQSLPANAKVSGDPSIYMLAAEANLDFTPAPWNANYSPVDRPDVPQDEWLLLTEKEYANPKYFFPSDVRGRSVAFCENAFPGAKHLDFDVCLLRPLVQ